MAEDPFWPAEKNSSTSRTSVRCRWRISVENLSRDEATMARVAKTSACRSRWITWVEAGAGVSRSFRQTYSSTKGSMLAKVPTAPEIFPTEITSRARTRRAMSRRTSSAHSAIFHPNVTGSAWMPCVRPIITVPRCSRARLFRTSKTPSASRIRSVRACRIWTAKAVSRTSELVIPTWRKRESSPICSATEVSKAMTSCLTFFSISLILATSKDAFFRTRARASAGIHPWRTIASIARISMSSQIRNRFSSCQMAAISGRVYRSITPSPPSCPRDPNRSSPRVPEAAFPTRGPLEFRHDLEAHPQRPGKDDLRDPVPAPYGERFLPEVREDHANLAAIVGVDRPRRVEARHAVADRQAAARPHLSLDPRRHRQGDPRGDHRPPHRRDDDLSVDVGFQVHAGRPFRLVRGERTPPRAQEPHTDRAIPAHRVKKQAPRREDHRRPPA